MRHVATTLGAVALLAVGLAPRSLAASPHAPDRLAASEGEAEPSESDGDDADEAEEGEEAEEASEGEGTSEGEGESSASDEERLDGEAIAQRALEESNLGFEEGEAILSMRITRADGRTLPRKLRSRSSRTEEGAVRTRITFTEPEDQAGIELLIRERDDGADRQYLYLPRLDRVRRLTGGAKNGRFQDSDFTYADLEQRHLRNARYERLDDAEYAGRPVYRVAMRPKEDATDPAYGRVVASVDEATWIPLRVVFRDREGQKLKTLEVKKLERRETGYVATRLVMSHHQRGSRTVLEVERLNPDASFPPSIFRSSALGQ